jgi:hypothetical protein
VIKLICALVLLLSMSITQAEVVLINNKAVPQTKLYRYEIQSIFTLNAAYWSNGIPVTPIFLSFDDPLHALFVTQILHLTPYNFDIVVGNKIQQGAAKHYVSVSTLEEAITAVESISGAIAYVPYAHLTLKNTNVRAIEVLD